MIFLPKNPCCNDSSPLVNTTPCNVEPVLSENVKYSGPSLSCTEVQPCDSLSVVLQKMNEQICDIWEILNSLTTTTSTSTSTTTSAPVCKTYTATKESTFNTMSPLQYTDCFGIARFIPLYNYDISTPSEITSTTFCALEGSIVASNDITIVDQGVCNNPQMAYQFEMTYSPVSNIDACNSIGITVVYSNIATLDGLNPFLAFDPGLSVAVPDGYYCLSSGCPNSSGKQWVQVTGGSGAITQSANC